MSRFQALLMTTLALAICSAAGTQAAQFTVNSAADKGLADIPAACTLGAECTLRAAVTLADAGPGGDTITFDHALDGVPIVLTIPCPSYGCFDGDPATGDLDITKDLTIIGNGVASTIVQAGPDAATSISRVFTAVSCADCIAVAISGMTIRYGGPPVPGGSPDGGIAVDGPFMTITDTAITDNRGGGIRMGSYGTLVLDRVTVARNTRVEGAGLAVYGAPTVSIANSTFSDNVADDGAGGGKGGALSAEEGTAPITISNTTFSGNRATSGCAIYDRSADLSLHDVTVADNCAPGSGATAVVAGAAEWFGTIRLRNTIIASPSGVVDCATEANPVPIGDGTFVSEGDNLVSDFSCALAGAAGDVQGTDPLLGPLADNGGPTRTHAPLFGSPAIDTGSLAACPATDQRGSPRPRDGDGDGVARCDKGAVELAAGPPPPPPPATGAIQGLAWNDANGDRLSASEPPLPNASICLVARGLPADCHLTDAAGHYGFAALAPGRYYVYERLAANRAPTTPRVAQGDVAAGSTATVDFGSRVLPPPPSGLLVDGQPAAGGPPAHYRQDPLTVAMTPPCLVDAATATLDETSGARIAVMSEVPPGSNRWTATFSPPFDRNASRDVITVEFNCADGSLLKYRTAVDFIDPSGGVVDACTALPLRGATVTLLKDEPGSAAPVVPDPGEHLPVQDPEATDGDGRYGWDVVPGRWRIQVAKAGYGTVLTDPFDVPPPKLGLDITLTPTAGCNTAPTATDDAYATDQAAALHVSAPGVLANDADAEHDPLTARIVTGAANGRVELAADGSFTYTPVATFFGTDSFTYKASDGRADSKLATATITVRRTNRPPVAKDDTYTTTKNRAFSIPAPGVLANDADPEGARLTARLVCGAAHGIVLLEADGSFVYLPRPGFVGGDTFTYAASDGVNASNTATVTIAVSKKNERDGDDDDVEHQAERRHDKAARDRE